MKPYQVIGWTLLQTSAVTAITSTRIYHGLRPDGTVTPSINYYQVGGATRQNGMEAVTYSINCRTTGAGTARDLARVVVDLFHGSSSTGIYGYQNSSFEISRASMEMDAGLIPETEDGIFNAPVDIMIVYPSSTVS